MKKAYIIGACDTKFAELDFVRQRLQRGGLETALVDVGAFEHAHPADVPAPEVAGHHPTRKDLYVNNKGRGDFMIAMAEALEQYLLSRNDIAGVIGLGGSGGTSLITRGMRALPIGLPKVMVSTVASGNVGPYVGASDIFMLYSVTDIAGINEISHTILTNAANALIGMLNNEKLVYHPEKPAIGMTMFGVTTPCVNAVRRQLERDYECLVFHATGTGGRSMEKLLDSGYLHSVVDITLTEVADLHMGGIMSAGEERLDAIIRRKIPYVGSGGALDMVNFGGIETVPEKYKDRLLYKHNQQVTLMRTTPAENVEMGRWIAHKLNRMETPVRFLLPEKGTSLLSVEGQPFYDPEADNALFDTLEREVNQTDLRQLIRLPYSINDDAFVQAIVDCFREIN